MNDLRSELRMAASKEIRLRVVDGGLVCLGTMVDLSLSGARMRIPLPILPGSRIELMFDDHQHRLQATVIWTSKTEIGIAFDPAIAQPSSTAA